MFQSRARSELIVFSDGGTENDLCCVPMLVEFVRGGSALFLGLKISGANGRSR